MRQFVIIFVEIVLIYCGLFSINSCKSNVLQNKTHIQLKKVEDFQNNDAYLILNLDIDNDGIADKVISSKQYEGDELYFFKKNKASYKLMLESINFSQDGGNIIGNIFNEGNFIVINTFFPNGGDYQANYYINYKENTWFLDHVEYITNYWQDDYTKTYHCIVQQDLNMAKLVEEDYVENIKQIPEESKRKELCEIKYCVEDLNEFLLRFSENQYNDYRTVKGIDRYKNLIEEIPLNSESKSIYKEIVKNLEELKINEEANFLKLRIDGNI